MKTLIRYFGMVAAVILTIYLVPSVSVASQDSWLSILLAALVWSVIVIVIKPVLRLLTLPVTIVTLGISALIINALLFWAMTLLVPGFYVSNFASAFIGAIVLSILSWLINLAL